MLHIASCTIALSCVPDAPEHPCAPGSAIYNECEPVVPGSGCTNDSQCRGDNGECVDGVCVCEADCVGKNCGDDGCGGSCGQCGAEWQCGSDRRCFDPCEGKECGNDWRGDSCGECEEGWHCGSDQVCLEDYWSDLTAGLTWENPPASEMVGASAAKQYCQDLNLAGYSDWRLPTIAELRSLLQGCLATTVGGACEVGKDDCLSWSCKDISCDGCMESGGPASGCYWPNEMEGACSWYWSSSAMTDRAGFAWLVNFATGRVYSSIDTTLTNVRCVH